MKIAIASDRVGYVMKEVVINYLRNNGIAYTDFGCFELERCDYTVYAQQVARAVCSGEYERGILLDSNGCGMAMVANRFEGIWAATVDDIYSARMTRRHNNANILCIGARITGPAIVLDSVDVWLKTPFDGGMHVDGQKRLSALRAAYLKKGACADDDSCKR